MPGSQSTWWGAVLTSKGENYPGKGHLARGHQWGKGRMIHNEAPSAAPAVVPGKGGFSWGGRGRGWDWMVPQAPCQGNPPGNPPWREEQALPGSKGGGAKGREPGARSQQPRRGWNPKGQSHFGRDQCSGGHQWGKGRMIHNKAPSAAPALVFGKGALPWGGRGHGWNWVVPQASCWSNLPGNPPNGECPNLGSWRGGRGKGEGQGKQGTSRLAAVARQGDKVTASAKWEPRHQHLKLLGCVARR